MKGSEYSRTRKMRHKVLLIIILLNIEEIVCKRKMAGGEISASSRKFMVYFVQSPKSSKSYDSWLCGGALISEQQVITAAGCLTDVSHLYVIAGYRKYINGRGIDYNECTRDRKQRVVKTCVPQNYDISNESIAQWMNLDIGVATLEKPYNLTDQTWRLQCSYIPQPIRISFEDQKLDTDAVAFGWGSNKWRLATDVIDHNSRLLQEIHVKISAKEPCMDAYQPTVLQAIIKRYMYCVMGGGNIDGDGRTKDTGYREDFQWPWEENKSPDYTLSRRNALCQNDHGGPLIAWHGSEAVLIGVACTSVVDNMNNICKAPSVFTSTHCVGKIIECLIASAGSDARRSCTEDKQLNGIGIQDTSIDWGQESEEFDITGTFYPTVKKEDSYGDSLI